MAKILLTGIAGFIGSHTAKALAERGDEVVGIDNFNEIFSKNIEQILKIADDFAKDVCLSYDNYIGENMTTKYGKF